MNHMQNPTPISHFHPTLHTQDPNITGSLRVPLQNLSDLRTRMDSLQRFISHSINTNTLLTNHHIEIVSTEIISAVHQVLINATALVAAGAPLHPPTTLDSKVNVVVDEEDDVNSEIVELDSVELLAEHLHFCEVCGKGFTRDANLRMHMRAHGERFKTREALAKKHGGNTRLGTTRRFSCPFEGCKRNKVHEKFRSLKSVSCARNHFKRTHCPKTHTCERCRKKSFAVLSDLKAHAKHCRGESTWKCTCGNTFSRKEKLLGHVALFEGHVPAIENEVGEEEEKGKLVVEVEDVNGALVKESDCLDELPEDFFDDLDDFGFGSVENKCLQEPWDFPKI